MGYELARFEGDVDEELVCPICSGVFEEPQHSPRCEHAFCKTCIHKWIDRQPSCPVDRQPIAFTDLKPAPRILRNLLSRLLISCDFAELGCLEVLPLESLESHSKDCEHNPQQPIACEQCDTAVPRNEMANHNCIREMRQALLGQQNAVKDLQQNLEELRHDISVIRVSLQECARAARLAVAPSMPDAEETSRWAETLKRARVTRWGGMISTPDSVLQQLIGRALAESGCPALLASELMENAHERRWPDGLRTLEVRQANRRHYENYVCRRIPGKQAVVVMANDNVLMPDDMVLTPGLVMIFAHGID